MFKTTWPWLPLRVDDDGRSRVRRIPRASPLVDAAKRKARVCVKRRRTHSAASFGVTVTPQRGCEREGVFDVLRCPSRRLDPARGVAATRPPSPPCPAPCPSDLVAQKYVFPRAPALDPPAEPRQSKICQSSPADQIPAMVKNARSRTYRRTCIRFPMKARGSLALTDSHRGLGINFRFHECGWRCSV